MKSRNERESANKVSRRDFARAVAMTASVAVLPAQALEQAASETAPVKAPEIPKEVAAEVEAKYAEIQRLYGAKLSPEQKEEVRRQLVAQVPGLQKLRAYPLTNSDAPATVLRLAAERM